MFALYGFLLSGPAAVGDTALYYVWRDKGCLTADKALGRVFLEGMSGPAASRARSEIGAKKI
jgi:hypothetical protein